MNSTTQQLFTTKKRISVISMVLLLFFTGSCKTDLGDVYERLDDHDTRLKLLETKINKANTDIKTLGVLIKAQDKKISIVSYKKTTDEKGYEFTMSDGSKIILKHGQKPMVNVKKHRDGLFYWTIDGEFMKDADNNMIKAQGSDGFTPTLRVNASNQWEVSRDGGKTWQIMRGPDGTPVVATGPKGEDAAAQLEISETTDTVIIKYNGTTYTIPKAKTTPTRPKLPIEYVAEYNINILGDGLTNDHRNDASGFFNWYEVTGTTHERFNPTGKNIFDNAEIKDKYYLASQVEWRGVLPDIAIDWDDREKIKTDVAENIMVAGVTASYTADYNNKTRNNSYAIRFKGNDDKYRAAYRYQYTNNPLDTESSKRMLVTVTVRYLGPEGKAVTLADIAKPEYWSTEGAEYITRTFPLSGHVYHEDGKDKVYRRGERGYYWTSTEHPGNNSVTEEQRKLYAIYFGIFEAHLDLTEEGFYLKERYASIRPFIKY